MHIVLLVMGLLGLFALAVCRWVIQAFHARRSRLAGPDAIDEGFFLKVGGLEQWVQIRGGNRSNPVLLLLHGGPGVSYIPFGECFRSWERDFTVVQWDQRGAGKTFGRNKTAPLGIDLMVADGLEVAEYLHERFSSKVVLMAHSWGSILGIRMAARRPDLFSHYFAAGQVVDMQEGEALSYELLRTRLQGNKQALAALEKAGPPPYEDIKRWMVKQRLIVMTSPPPKTGKLPGLFTAPLFTPGYSLMDCWNWFKGFGGTTSALFAEMMSSKLEPVELAIPAYFIHGDQDLQAPIEPVRARFAKDLVELPDEGHTVILSSPETFLGILRASQGPSQP